MFEYYGDIHVLAVSEENLFEYYGDIYTCILPRGGGIEPLGSTCFSESLIFSPTALFLQNFHFN